MVILLLLILILQHDWKSHALSNFGVDSITTSHVDRNVHDPELSLLTNSILHLQNQNTPDYSATYLNSMLGGVKIYSPKLFFDLRQKFFISKELFVKNLSYQNLICINSDSKSGERFWISSDGLIVLKTIKPYECRTLKSILGSYVEHLKSNPNSSIAAILGLYRVKLKGKLFSKYYLVTRNVYPLLGTKDTFINRKYDLKGSTQGRSASSRAAVE